MFSSKDLFFTPAASGAYTVSKSLRFRSSATAYLNRTFTTPTSSTIFTFSTWLKRGQLGTAQSLLATSSQNAFYFDTDNKLYIAHNNVVRASTTAVYRDPLAWYHVVYSQNGSAITIYINNVSAATGTGSPFNINTAIAHYIGFGNTGAYLDGYLAEVNFIDGQALTPSSFGAYDTNGIWQPTAYSGSGYGNNGFYLKFTTVGATSGSNTGYGQDFSGNGNYWTTNNFGTTSTAVTYDSMLDSPTNYADTGNGVGNYPVLNPLSFNSSNVVDGNLAYLGANLTSTRASFAMPTSGKWYWELTPVNASPNYVGFGLMGASTTGTNNYGTAAAGLWGLYPTTTMYLSINGSAVNTTVSTPTLGVVFAAAYDADTGNFWIGYSSSGSGSPTWFNSTGGTTGNPATGANPVATISAQTLFPAVSGNDTTATKSAINFGQRPFALTVPSGYSSLNTQNLTTPPITNGAQYMAATLWDGNSSTRSISNGTNNTIGTTFPPDFVWIKDRNTARSHRLFDTVRGATLALFSDATSAETTLATDLTAFDSTGFALGAGAGSNATSETYVGWQWKASGSTGTISPAGTIAATGSVNQTAGFSIAQFTATGSNATVGHGLGVVPSMVIVKDAASAGNWAVWHTSLTSGTYYLFLNTTAAQANTSAIWTAAPSSTVVSIGTWHTADRQIMYCFAPVAGYSAFGSYTGNGSTDGPFIYTGFRPRWVLYKRIDSTGDWAILDTSRSTYNVQNDELYPNSSIAETAAGAPRLDSLSNGFKIRNGGGAAINASGGTYIYAAFAENPFKISRAR
jgi:hypothetical protein